MEFRWSEEKDAWLREHRGISFEDIVVALDNGRLLATRRRTGRSAFAHQEILYVDIGDYVFMIPFVRDQEWIFLKTIIPTRKGTRDFLRGLRDETKGK
jgi:uncharacterized DUF497 family protein